MKRISLALSLLAAPALAQQSAIPFMDHGIAESGTFLAQLRGTIDAQEKQIAQLSGQVATLTRERDAAREAAAKPVAPVPGPTVNMTPPDAKPN